ncbi:MULTISPECIES: SDR family oxidoreductase [unclassified Corynebacterium]|uniref:SDR family oxidoreductase n=1 Tax=unclassified Corynebacterium TaxID=2624378 RepID=UPI0035250096
MPGIECPSQSSSTLLHVLVTGARGGVGSAVVEHLRNLGHRVSAWDLPEYDVTDSDSIAAAIADLDDSDPLDALVHTPGVLRPDSALNPDPAALRFSLEVNLLGTVAVCAPVARRFVERRGGSLVVVSSNAAAVPRAGMAAYGASKAATTSWVRTLGLECAPHGVRCNVISPGSTDTPMLRGMWPEGSDQSAQVIAGTPEQYRLGIPLQRLADPSDIAGACAFLISPAARHITMHDLRIDGGATLDA